MILTPRLRLRALTARDLTLFRALYCDARTMRHIGKPLSRGLAAASLHSTVAATRKPGGPRFFVIAERESQRGVGLCSMRPVPPRDGRVELGIMLVPRACGHGYGREALGAMIRFAFAALPITTVWVQHSRANAGAAQLNAALGFREARRMLPQSAHRGQCVWILRRRNQLDPPIQSSRGKTMSNVIGFLEQIGANAAMRHASREALLRAMREEEIAPTQQHALLHTQRSVLDDLTGARDTMYLKNTAIAPPKKKAPAKKKPAKKTPSKKPAKKAPAKRKK